MNSSNLCCCCLSGDCFKNIFNEYYYEDLKENIYELIFNIFDIKISKQSPLICESCSALALEAARFRRSVIRAQAAILDRVELTTLETSRNVLDTDDFKDHIVGEYVDSDDGSETSWDNDVTVTIDNKECIIKTEPLDDVMDIKQPNINYIKAPTLMGTKNARLSKKVNVWHHTNAVKHKSRAKEFKAESQTQSYLKQDSLTLIKNSNICLFESLKTKFRCFYCKESFLHAKELREHSATHNDDTYLRLCFNRLKGKSFKNVEISDLKCKICDAQLLDLNDLRNHLVKEHGVEFQTEKNMLIPYRLEIRECVVCRQKFNTFFKLSIHMNSHFANHVCDICGVAYINRISLRGHIFAMHTESECKLCGAPLANVNVKVKHMRTVHNKTPSKRYCLLCDQTFRYAYLLDEHKVKSHGVKRNVSECSHCGKVFFTAQNLRIHVRSVHIRERNYGCSYCDMRFFTKCDQTRHEATHLDVRSFSCNFCDGAFKSKHTLTRHCRRQHNTLLTINTATEVMKTGPCDV